MNGSGPAVRLKKDGTPASANWGGPRSNSGGARPGSGGARLGAGGMRPGAGRPRKPVAWAIQTLSQESTLCVTVQEHVA